MRIDYSAFSERSRQSIAKAFDTSRRCNYVEISPSVMMVSIIQEGKDMVYFLLQHMGVDRIVFCEAVGRMLNSIPQDQNVHQPQFSQNLKSILAKSVDLSREMRASLVALEHLFTAFILVPGPMKNMMDGLGITQDKLLEAVTAFRQGNINHDSRIVNEYTINLNNLLLYGKNLSLMAEEGKIDPAIGRDSEIRHILQILSRKTKNNPILVGAPGTGKTAIVEGLAHRLNRGDVPQDLSGVRLYSLDISALLAGTSQHGEFEARLKEVIKEAKSDPNIVLFIDEIHLLIGAGESINAANILKPELARGEIKVIGATTTAEYVKYIESDKAFERRFQKLDIEEPDIESAITIMRGIKQKFESFHKIKILDEAIVSAVTLSARYISDRFLPDKAIDLMDEAASKMRIDRSSVPQELDELSRLIRSKEMERESLKQDEQEHDLTAISAEIDNLREKENDLNAKWMNERQIFDEVQQKKDIFNKLNINREEAEIEGRYEDALSIKLSMETVQAELNALIKEMDDNESPLLKSSLDEDDIRQVVTAWTGIPAKRLKEDDSSKLLSLENTLRQSVIGQDAAVSAVSKVIRRNRMGFGDPSRPIGSFLFLGTTGVGKTELAKTLADYLFNSRDMIVRIDMSEYQQEYSVSRLFGAPPGYVGYDAGGQLTEAVRRKPYSIVLLDEIEKAHPKVFETMLQVLDDGRMTDGQGRVVNFKNTIIIMTSNIGASAIAECLVGTDCPADKVEIAKQQALSLMREKVAPEFINRIDDIVMFFPLGKEEVTKIVELQFGNLQKMMAGNGINILYDRDAIDFIAAIGYIPEYGARPIKRAINDYLINELTMKLLSGEISKDAPIKVNALHDSLIFRNL